MFKKKIVPLVLAVAFIVTAFILPSNFVQAATVKQEFINQNRSHQVLAPTGLVIHDTDNAGATAQNNRDYFNRVYVAASAHYFVDWLQDIQCIPEGEVAWHAGPTANHRYLSIEMCMPSNHDVTKFNAVYQNTVDLAAQLCKKYGWNYKNIFSHYYISMTYKETNHEDPLAYLNEYGKSWDVLVNDIQKAIDGTKASNIVTTASTNTQTNANVADLQKNLNRLLNYNLVVDNDYGPLTTNAVKEFQVMTGLSADGVTGTVTQNMINQILAKPMLQQGSKGNVVKFLQYRLGVSNDGDFGVLTKQAVIAFQKKNGLTPDGIVGVITWSRLIG